jgi:hypothetical protein
MRGAHEGRVHEARWSRVHEAHERRHDDDRPELHDRSTGDAVSGAAVGGLPEDGA